MLKIGRNPANGFPIRRGVVHVSLPFGWGVEWLTYVRITMDGVGEVKVPFHVKHQIIRRAQLDAITSGVESFDVAVDIDVLDTAGLIIWRWTDRQTFAPGEPANVGDI